MRSLIILLALLAGSAAMAQQAPLNLPPRPPDPLLTPDDLQTVQEAIDKLKVQGLDVNYSVVEHLNSAIGPTQLPMVGFALSRSSNDPKACALLKRIEPSAVCMK